MKIGLIDVDGHKFPNLPLMKMAAYYKSLGATVEFYTSLNGIYDKVYMSKIFDFTKDYQYPINAKTIVRGGTGYNLHTTLPNEIEKIYPDYSLYGITDTAYGFLSRGCPRDCDFCIVSEKEGYQSIKTADLSEFWNGQKHIMLLDPNLLACKDHMDLLHQLIESRAYIHFTQGIDIRLMNEQRADLISKCKVKQINFAWDFEKGSGLIIEKLKEFKRITQMKTYKTQVYVLTNFNTPFEFDLERVYTLKSLGYKPYIMIYDKQNAPKNIRRLQRWVNNRRIFNTVDKFEDYAD